MGRYDEARQELEKATGIDPAYASAWNNLGAALGRLGRVDEEVAAYRKAVELDPGYADVRHNLGLALVKSGAWEAGESEMKRALELDPTYAPAYLNLARHLWERSRGAEATDLLVKGSARVPSDPDIKVLLGESLLRQGRKQEAMAALEEALRLKPDQTELKSRIEALRSAPVPSSSPDGTADDGGGR
jgi:Flp pilus assembly protein TadD